MTLQSRATGTQAFDATKVLAWWAELQPDPSTNRPGDRGALADLRRCGSTLEVQLLPSFEPLVRRLPRARTDDLAVVAAVTAHVREHDSSARVAEQMARVTPERQLPHVTPQRFRRLLQMRGPDERLATGARLARLLKHKLNLLDLADGLYAWDRSPELQRRWARAYYSRLPQELLK